jgi:hypothetical protein
MRILLVTLLVASGGCNSSASTPADKQTPVPPKQTAGPAAPVAPAAPTSGTKVAAACPDQAQLHTIAAKVWKLDAKRLEGKIVCASGRFPAAGWAVATDVAAKGWGYFHRLAVIGQDGSSIAIRDGDTGKDLLLSMGAVDDLATADLDGDGIDELVARTTSAYKYTPETIAVEVDRIAGSTLKLLLTRTYSTTTNTDRAADRGETKDPELLCDGSYEITPQHTLVIHGKLNAAASEKPTAEDCVDGTETYAANAGRVEKR